MVNELAKLLRESSSLKLQQLMNHKRMNYSLKDDQSPVTELDLMISSLVRDYLERYRCKGQNKDQKNWSLLSEEEKERELCFPLVILDPIDGTDELRQGVPECAISLALMPSPDLSRDDNQAFIYNPFSGFEMMSHHLVVRGNHPYDDDHPLLGLVSRLEWKKGLYKSYEEKAHSLNMLLSSRGSIAFKLGILASSAADFVLSMKPKNLWDIAAGTVLCEQQGIHFYEEGKRVTHLDRLQYRPPLWWCRPELNVKVASLIDSSNN